MFLSIGIGTAAFAQLEKYDEVVANDRQYLYSLMYKSICSYHYNIGTFPNPDRLYDRSFVTHECPILEDNEAYGFKVERYSDSIYHDSIVLYKYWMSVASYVWMDLDLPERERTVGPIGYFPKFMETGIIGYNLIGTYPKYILISGFLFLDDVTNLFLDKRLSDNSIENYIKIRFYNYKPSDIDVRKRRVYFTSNQTTSVYVPIRYKVLFLKRRGKIEEELVKVGRARPAN